jgi:hypothetical protein
MPRQGPQRAPPPPHPSGRRRPSPQRDGPVPRARHRRPWYRPLLPLRPPPRPAPTSPTTRSHGPPPGPFTPRGTRPRPGSALLYALRPGPPPRRRRWPRPVWRCSRGACAAPPPPCARDPTTQPPAYAFSNPPPHARALRPPLTRHTCTPAQPVHRRAGTSSVRRRRQCLQHASQPFLRGQRPCRLRFCLPCAAPAPAPPPPSTTAAACSPP